MEAYVGWLRETRVAVTVIDRGGGAGEVTCFECEGTGRFLGAPDGQDWACVDCKATGLVLIATA